jgi:hypothetical protein
LNKKKRARVDRDSPVSPQRRCRFVTTLDAPPLDGISRRFVAIRSGMSAAKTILA